MPGEWEPHERCWMGWPYRTDNWRDDAKPAQQAFTDVATAISRFEPVTVCADPDQIKLAREMLPDHIPVVEVPQDDAWFRDSGPTFVARDVAGGKREVAGINWIFNSWGGNDGGCYANWDKDLLVANRICKIAGLPCFDCPMVLEGGSIHVDGEGTLITTEECLLNKNRNPNLGKEQIEQNLKDMLGVKKLVWLPLGRYGDEDTNGHVDNMACFARPGAVLLCWTNDENDPQYERSKKAYDVLTSSTDARGRRIEVIKVPIPPTSSMRYRDSEVAGLNHEGGAVPRQAGEVLAGSYVNFYIANGAVIMPAFGEPTDEQAKQVLQDAFPDRKVVAVPTARDILLGGGNIHCITQQQPSADGQPKPGTAPDAQSA